MNHPPSYADVELKSYTLFIGGVKDFIHGFFKDLLILRISLLI